MALWCLKYSLAFLLGAMTLGLFIILQLQRDVIRVEIHWKRPPPSSYQSFVDIVAIKSPSMGANSSNDNISRSDVSSIHLNHPPQEHKKDASHHDASLVVPEQAQLQKSGMNLLSRHPRQVSPLLEGQSQLSSIVMTTRPPRTKESTTRKASDSKKSRQTGEIENALRSVVPIEDVLSKTAPDWVGASLPPVSRDDVNCGDNVCMEHLSEVDRDLFKTCIRRTVAKKDRIGPILPIANSSCHFQNGTRRHPVALASFPGSGNTWMRGLLQKITGICAGMQSSNLYTRFNDK